jgi:Zn-dependent protease
MLENITATIFLGRAIGLLLGFTIHEWAHAYSAYRLGGYRALPDPQRLSLDPRVHVEPIGIFLALFVGFGWARPVPVNTYAFRNGRRDLMIVAFAGPLTNLIIAFVFALVLRLMDVGGALVDSGFVIRGSQTVILQGDNRFFQVIYEVFSVVIFFNLLLFFFNLIPLAPLDGWKVLMGLLPPQNAYALSRYEQQSTYLLFFLILLGFVGFSFVGILLSPAVNSVFELFTGFGYYPFLP